MRETSDGYASRSEIARLAGVRRTAVSNWERRHPDFPPYIQVGGEELFEIEAITAWLDRRMIASNALKPGEPAGSTYGQRLRGHLTNEPGAVPAPAIPSAPASDAGNVLWDELTKLRGPVGTTDYMGIVQTLVYLHARGVTDIRTVEEAERALGTLAPEIRAALADPRPSKWLDGVLADIASTVDQAVTALGHAEVFRILLDRFDRVNKHDREFYTPSSVVGALVGALSPDSPKHLYDPACGVGELLVAAASRIQEKSHRAPLSVRGETIDDGARALAMMNISLHGLDPQLGHRPRHKIFDVPPSGERFDYVIANPPFSLSDWHEGEPYSSRQWRYGVPPKHNSNFAWLQYVVDSLTESGRAAVLMPNNASYSTNPREHVIRSGLVEDGCVEGLVALPTHLFRSTAIGVTMWLLTAPGTAREEILFIDASGLGRMTSRTQRELTEDDQKRLAAVVGNWRKHRRLDTPANLATSVSLDEIRDQDFNLNPRRYFGAPSAGAPAGRQAVKALQLELNQLHARMQATDARVERELGRLIWPAR